MLRADLDAVRTRANAATPGPWVQVVEQDGDEDGPNGQDGPTRSWFIPAETDANDEPFLYEVSEEADAEFIAHARQDIPVLLAETERLRGNAHTTATPDFDEARLAAYLLGQRDMHSAVQSRINDYREFGRVPIEDLLAPIKVRTPRQARNALRRENP